MLRDTFGNTYLLKLPNGRRALIRFWSNIDPRDGDVQYVKSIARAQQNGEFAYRLRDDSVFSVLIANDAELSPTRPPAAAEFLLTSLLPPQRAEKVLGDIEELFNSDLAAEIGVRRARLRYAGRATRELAPIFRRWLKRIGLVGLAVAAFRRLSGT
jgi:hypothetical protein